MGILGVKQEYVDEGFVHAFNQMKVLNEKIEAQKVNVINNLAALENRINEILKEEKVSQELLNNKINDVYAELEEVKSSMFEILKLMKTHFKEPEQKPKTTTEQIDDMAEKVKPTQNIAVDENTPLKVYCLKCRDKTEIVDGVVNEVDRGVKGKVKIMGGKCKICGCKVSLMLRK